MKNFIFPIAPLVLGQFPQVSATELGGWLLCAACVLVILNQGADFWRKNLKEKPTPADTYVDKTVCKIIHAEANKKLEKSENSLEALRKEIKADVKGIHDRINDVLKAVSRMEGNQT